MKQRFLCMVGAALAAVTVGAVHAAGALTYCIDASPEGFDIAQYETSPSFDAAGIALYDQIVELAPGTSRIVPGLAESWQISADGLQYTFKLRSGVTFHSTPWFKPGRAMNADDVLFSIQRMADKTHWAHAAARNGFVYWEGMSMSQIVKSVEKLDAMTVRFTLARPEAPFLSDLAIASIGSVFSAEYAGQLRAVGKLDQLNTEPVGTGPFILKSYQKDSVIRYSANPVYWGGVPKADPLIFAITRDADVRVQRLKAGECMVAAINNESAPQIAGDPNLGLVVSRPLRTSYLAPNAQKAPMSDQRFREALWLAIDKVALIKAVWNGRAVPATSFLPEQMWGLDKSLTDRRDPVRARQLVKASGYDGRELTLFITSVSESRRGAESMQADWAAVGIKVKVVALELGEVYKRTGQGEHDITFLSWYSDNADPDNFFTPNLSCASVAGGGNKARWCNPAFDALIGSATRTTDVAKRTALYKQAQRLIYDEVAVIPLAWPETTTVVSKRVQGYLPSPLDLHDFRAVSVK
jgi:dipeptide transport system substrate-binding protein